MFAEVTSASSAFSFLEDLARLRCLPRGSRSSYPVPPSRTSFVVGGSFTEDLARRLRLPPSRILFVVCGAFLKDLAQRLRLPPSRSLLVYGASLKDLARRVRLPPSGTLFVVCGNFLEVLVRHLRCLPQGPGLSSTSTSSSSENLKGTPRKTFGTFCLKNPCHTGKAEPPCL